METCATHGLRFDPAQHEGCVLCRQLVRPPRGANGGEGRSKAIARRLSNVLGAVMLCGVIWTAYSGLGLRSQTAASTCTGACARNIEPCFDPCQGRADGENCQWNCSAELHACLSQCESMKGLGPAETRFAYSDGGGAPQWSVLQPIVERALPHTAGCELRRGPYSARFDVLPDGSLARVAVTSSYEPASMCLKANFLEHTKGLPPNDERYAFVVHGLQPQPKPRPRAAAKAPEPEPPQQVDYLEIVNRMSAQQQAQAQAEALIEAAAQASAPNPGAQEVAVAGPVGAAPKLVARALLQDAGRSCPAVPTKAYSCLTAIDPIKPALVEIPVSTQPGSSTVRAYEANRAGLGFDCFRLTYPAFPESEYRRRDQEGRTYKYPMFAVILAAPPESGALLSATRLMEPFDLHVTNAPWPALYRARISYDARAFGGPLNPLAKPPGPDPQAACIKFTTDQPVTIYLGMAAWMDGPSAHDGDTQDEKPFNDEILHALGLKGSWTRNAR